jgi:hypothetical protein
MKDLANEIHLCLSALSDAPNKVRREVASKITLHFAEITRTFVGLIADDKFLFEDLFLMNFNEKEKSRIIGRYLGVEPWRLAANDVFRDEIQRFSVYVLVCDNLAKIYPSISSACSLNMIEFCASWSAINGSGVLRELLFSKIKDSSMLAEHLQEQHRTYKERIENGTDAIDRANETLFSFGFDEDEEDEYEEA